MNIQRITIQFDEILTKINANHGLNVGYYDVMKLKIVWIQVHHPGTEKGKGAKGLGLHTFLTTSTTNFPANTVETNK